MSIAKYSKALLYGVYVLAAVFTVVFFMGLDGTGGKTPQNIDAAGPYLIFAYILSGLALVLALVFSIINTAANPSSLKTTILGIVGVVVIVGLGYLLSSDEPLNFTSKDLVLKYNNDSGILKSTDAGLISVYILLGVSVVGMFYTEIRDFFKR